MVEDFLQGERVTALVNRAQELRSSKKIFSDVVDADGCQYVDLVQEGGGVLGIGLVGYVYMLEQAGIRFYSLAGTSAGAISTTLMGSMAKIGDPVAMKLLRILSEMNLFDFVDGPRGIKRLIQKRIEGKKGLLFNFIWNACSIYSLLKNKLGLNPGKNFEQWFAQNLKDENIRSLNDLMQLREKLPALTHRLGEPISQPKLAIITSEITTHTKVDFPRMAKLYWENPAEIPPSALVRASMAIPLFYYPFAIKNIPDAGQRNHPEWIAKASFYGKVPQSVKFVDGGLLSNFPINIFHADNIPSRPTFGVRLSTYRKEHSKTDSFFEYTWAVIKTMRQIHDYDFILRNPDYKQLICNIEADKEFNWLNFDMQKNQQKELFILGAEKALSFLEQFDWEHYKQTRAKNLEK